MKRSHALLGLFAAGAFCALAASAAEPAQPARKAPRAFEPRDLILMNRITEMALSPDGSRLVYTQRVTDLEANRGRTDLWLVPSAGGEAPRRLTFDPAGDSSPHWAPDGRGVYFLSTRSGSSQVWYLPLEGGGESRQVTKLPLDVGGYLLSPDGKSLAVALEVFVDCATLECTTERLAAPKKGSGQLYDRIFVRHWDAWMDGRRNHLFVLPVDGGTPVDVAAGLDGDTPSKPFGGTEEGGLHPGRQVAGLQRPGARGGQALRRAVVDQFRPLGRPGRRLGQGQEDHRRKSRLGYPADLFAGRQVAALPGPRAARLRGRPLRDAAAFLAGRQGPQGGADFDRSPDSVASRKTARPST